MVPLPFFGYRSTPHWHLIVNLQISKNFQSTNQPINQSTNQPINPSTLQPFNPSTFQPFNSPPVSIQEIAKST